MRNAVGLRSLLPGEDPELAADDITEVEGAVPDAVGAIAAIPRRKQRDSTSPHPRYVSLTPLNAPLCTRNPFISDWSPAVVAKVRNAYFDYTLGGFYTRHQRIVRGVYGHEVMGHSRFNVGPPVFPCKRMSRVGGGGDARFSGTGDGEKLLCNLEGRGWGAALSASSGVRGGEAAVATSGGNGTGTPSPPASPCVIYSLGSNTDTSFERAMVAATPCSTVTLDCTVKEADVVRNAKGKWDPARMAFRKICLAGEERTTKRHGAPVRYTTLQTVLRELNHTSIDLLKVGG